MKQRVSRSKRDLALLNARLDKIRMSEYERLRAKAGLAQAEAVADFIFGATNAIRRLLKTRVICPIRRLAASLG